MSEALVQFIDQHVKQMKPLEKEANLAYWDFTTTGSKDSEEDLTRLQVMLRRLYADPGAFREFKRRLEENQSGDALLNRQSVLLYNSFLGNQMDEKTLEELTRREVSIESIFNTFRAELGNRRVTENELKEILRDSEDLILRRQAWEASKQVGVEVADQLRDLVVLRNKIASEIGFDNYYSMHLTLQEIDEAELFGVFDELDRRVRGIYSVYKSGLDGQLAQRFGLPPEDLRPWHYGDPFFQDAPLAEPKIRQFMAQTFSDQNIEALSADFYRTVGLDVSDVIANSDLYEREGKQQHAYCMHIDRTGDVRILCNIKPNVVWMSTMLHECGHAVYDKFLDFGLPYLLRQPAHILSTEAVALMMGTMPFNPGWLAAYTDVDEHTLESMADNLRRQTAGDLLIMSRWVPLMCHFERALYQDPHQDLNKLWWDLEEYFQMVPRPEERDAPDWAAKIHFSIAPVYYHNYLMGHLVASQLENYIRTRVLDGGGDTDRRFVTDALVGHYLIQKVFQPGATRHWQEALEYATEERLSPQYFVEQVSVF